MGPDILGERQSGEDVRTQNGTLFLSLSVIDGASFSNARQSATLAAETDKLSYSKKSSRSSVGVDVG
jgi:hypothetical protein